MKVFIEALRYSRKTASISTILGAFSGEKRFQSTNAHDGMKQNKNPAVTNNKLRLIFIYWTDILAALLLAFCNEGATFNLFWRINFSRRLWNNWKKRRKKGSAIQTEHDVVVDDSTFFCGERYAAKCVARMEFKTDPTEPSYYDVKCQGKPHDTHNRILGCRQSHDRWRYWWSKRINKTKKLTRGIAKISFTYN